MADQGTPGVFGRRLEGLDAWGNPTQQQFGNGLVDLRTYRPATGQMHTVCVGAGVGLCGTLEMNYDYDGWGNLTWQYQGQPQVSESFQYDKLHRMTQSLRHGSTNITVGYSYMANGNLLSKGDYSQGGSGYQYGSRPVVGGPAGRYAGPHAVTQVQTLNDGTHCYDYDAQGCASAAGAGCAGAADVVGNQVAQRRGAGCALVMRQVSYDVTHRPERIEADGKRIVFRYDGDGNRYLQRRQLANQPATDRDTTTVYPFPGYEVEVQRTGGTFTVASGRQMLGDYGIYTASVANPQGQVIYRHGDRLGSPAAQSDGQGQAVERRGFDAWGAPREGTWTDRPGAALGSAISPRGFTGHEHLDDVGGLIHMNGRAYDPRLGRFLSVDPIIQFPANSQSLNPYSYLMNNPMSGTDPTGYTCSTGTKISGHTNCDTLGARVHYINSPGGKDDNGARRTQESVATNRADGGTDGRPIPDAIGQFHAPVQTTSVQVNMSASAGVGNQDINLDVEEYLEAVRNGLWQTATVIEGFQTDAEVRDAGNRAAAKPELYADVMADQKYIDFVVATARATANARLPAGIIGEKFMILSIRGDVVIVNRIGVLEGMGGDITGFARDAGVIAHVHHSGLIQRPGPGDNSPPRSGIPNFMITHDGRRIWEIGRVNGADMNRTISSRGPGPWRQFTGR